MNKNNLQQFVTVVDDTGIGDDPEEEAPADLDELDQAVRSNPATNRNLQAQLKKTTEDFLDYQRGIIRGSFHGRVPKAWRGTASGSSIFKHSVVNFVESLLKSGKRINGLLQHQMNMRSSGLLKRQMDDVLSFVPFLTMF